MRKLYSKPYLILKLAMIRNCNSYNKQVLFNIEKSSKNHVIHYWKDIRFMASDKNFTSRRS